MTFNTKLFVISVTSFDLWKCYDGYPMPDTTPTFLPDGHLRYGTRYPTPPCLLQTPGLHFNKFNLHLTLDSSPHTAAPNFTLFWFLDEENTTNCAKLKHNNELC